jgi:non-specific serine/threonine protein kinase/serine/threonine-protein kinase
VTTDRWDRTKEVFDAALQQETAARAEYLRRACAGDDSLLNEVQSLLAAYEAAGTFIDQPIMAPRLAGEHTDPMTNRRIGPYRILRRTGRGGMADVYLAVRADRLYQRFVAMKVVKTGLDSEEVLRRFRHERQTLAVLDHPNIVKLLDAGTTDEGMPYLVMDFVQGQALDEYCDSRGLSTAERLELFRTICAAVHYAHQNLVVHRDLKPSNVLVTVAGVPKLLDFGIAKLLRPEYSPETIGLTRSELRPMTPEYASPEQIRGEPITTASDIYSLGVLLYRLLTGHPPYRVRSHAALDYEHAICETEPERPSAREDTPEKLRRTLRGDLDNIVLMAMRKEPQRRYASAEQFAEDVRRHLAGLPVLAHKDTFRYRTAKFVRRHKAGAVTAVLVAVLLVAGIAALIWQGRVAEAQRARAERRFDDVRQLARFVLHDLDDALRSGVTPARSKLIAQVLPYLDRLAREAPDASLEIDLIEGYLKVGDVQGNLYGPNLGDAKGAEQSYRRALQVAEALNRADPQGTKSRRVLALANQKLGELLSVSGDVSEALKLLRKALEGFETLRVASPSDVQAKDDILVVLERIAVAETTHDDYDGALRAYQRYVEVGEERFAPGSAERRRFVAKADLEVGNILGLSGRYDDGIQRIRRALQVYETLASRDLTNVSNRRSLSAAHVNLGDLLARAGRPREALDSYRTGLRTFEALSKDDPQNQQFLRDRAVTLSFQADALWKLGRKAESRQHTTDALRLFKRLAEQPDASAWAHREYAWLLVTTRFTALQDPSAALEHAQRATEMTNGSDPATLDTLALAHDLNGDTASALREERRALALLVDSSGSAHLKEELKINLAKFEAKLAKRSPAAR